MERVLNYIIDFLKEDKDLREEMHRVYKWCKRRNMRDNTAVITACILEVSKCTAAIVATAITAFSMLVSLLIMF